MRRARTPYWRSPTRARAWTVTRRNASSSGSTGRIRRDPASTAVPASASPSWPPWPPPTAAAPAWSAHPEREQLSGYASRWLPMRHSTPTCRPMPPPTCRPMPPPSPLPIRVPIAGPSPSNRPPPPSHARRPTRCRSRSPTAPTGQEIDVRHCWSSRTLRQAIGLGVDEVGTSSQPTFRKGPGVPQFGRAP